MADTTNVLVRPKEEFKDQINFHSTATFAWFAALISLCCTFANKSKLCTGLFYGLGRVFFFFYHGLCCCWEESPLSWWLSSQKKMEIQNFTIVTRTGSRGEFPITLDRFSLTSCLGEICEGKSKLINVFCHLDFVFIHIVLYGWGFSKCFQCHGFPDHNTRSLLLFFLYY